MRKQQHVWQQEHQSEQALPGLGEQEPSSGVVEFVKFLKQNGVSQGKAIDIGCGKGRNSVYLAQQGFLVEALDYIQGALDAAQQLAETKSCANKINFVQAAIDSPWPYGDNTFDIAVDCFSSIDIETLEGRRTYHDEMLRTLKPGGYALVTVVSADDEWESNQEITKPGPEPNSVTWLQNGKFQKNYDEAELREFYKDFEIVELEKISKPAFKMGRQGMATNFWVVLKKRA